MEKLFKKSIKIFSNNIFYKMKNMFDKKLFLIVFLGPDGAGKSSLINKLMKEYKSKGLNYYCHLYPSLNNKTRKKFSYPYSKEPYSGIISNFKVLYMLTRNFLNLLMIFAKNKEAKTIIWCDRYIYDIFADPLRYRLSKFIFSPRFINKFSLKPNFIIILNPPIQNIIKRSSEISLEELTLQSKSYDKLQKYFPESFLIRSNSPIKELSEVCKYEINKFIKNY